MRNQVWFRFVQLAKEFASIVSSYDGLWSNYLATLQREHFVVGDALTTQSKKDLFKSSVDLVEIEPHSFCNRVCTFCPNAFLDRRSNKVDLDVSLLTSVLDDLASISYNKRIRFALYSEPLANPNTINYIRLVREHLPKATIDVITNGDYLKDNMLDELAEVGLDILRISVYPKGYIWDVPEAKKQLQRICNRIGIKPIPVQVGKSSLVWDIPHEQLTIRASAKDIASDGYDRGRSMANMIDNQYQRMSPCRMVFSQFSIYHDGTVTPCCNIRNDNPDHKKYVIGKLTKNNSIFEIYSSQQYVDWRTSLSHVSIKKEPCNTCTQLVCNSRTNEQILARKIVSRMKNL